MGSIHRRKAAMADQVFAKALREVIALVEVRRGEVTRAAHSLKPLSRILPRGPTGK